MDERLKFIAAHQAGDESMTELCERFGVSRKTGYKLLHRYEAEGPNGLLDRPRAPRSHPNRVSDEVVGAVLRVRRSHPTWGSKKILAVLERDGELDKLPARSTIDVILKRAGLIVPKKKRRRQFGGPRVAPVVVADAPNDAWSIDYKGWFNVGDGTRCDPLTVNDVRSRASLECRAMVGPKTADVRDRLAIAFKEFGLPKAMLSDNGPPFGSTGIGGLSRLSVWLLRLGVRPLHIQPAHPEQNGRHERFHETLKAETASPPRRTIRAQQRAFDRFTRCYNEERPHEALDMRAPFDVYRESTRQMPSRVPPFEYGDEMEVRYVRADGCIKINGTSLYVGQALMRERVGLLPVQDEIWHLYAGEMRLGVLVEGGNVIVPLAEDLP